MTGYLLAQIATAPLYGKIGDVYGRKSVYLFAITLFTVASMLCGLAQNQPQLIAARVLQGVGSGALGPMAMAVLGDLVPPRQLGRWLGYQGAIFAVGGVAGPLAGGFFVDHLSWRWAFYFNVPLAIVSVILVSTKLHVPYRRVEHSIDYVGSALLTGALALFVLLLTAGGNDFEWVSPESAGLLAIVAVLAALFVSRERRVPEPFVPIRLLTNSVVRVADFLNFTSGLLFYCGIFFLPVFLQEVADTSPTVSGLLLIPFMSMTALATMAAGRRVERTGRYRIWPIAGGLLMTVGRRAARHARPRLVDPARLAVRRRARHRHRVRDADDVARAPEPGRGRGHGPRHVHDPRRPDARRDGRHRALRRRARGRAARPRRRRDRLRRRPARGVPRRQCRSAIISFLGALRLQEHPLREQARFT